MAEDGGLRGGGSTAALMFAVNFVVNMTVSIVAPFLPKHLEERELLPEGPAAGVTKGLLFASASVATLVITPWCPGITQRYGRITACALGLAFFAAGMAAFGSTAEIVAAITMSTSDAPSEHPTCELMLLFLARVTAACGGTLASMSSMSLALEANPGNRGVLMGASETAIGVGFSVGPSVGAAFFLAGGFPAPFLAAAGTALGLFPLLIVAQSALGRSVSRELHEVADAGHLESTAQPAWHSLAAVLIAIVTGLSMLSFGFLDPTLAPFEAATLGASTAGAGVLFSASAFPYALLGIVVGALVDNNPRMGVPLICLGGATLGLAFIGIPPVVPFMATWAWQTTLLLLTGFAAACAMVPAVPVITRLLHEEAHKSGRPVVSDDDVLSFTWMALTGGEMLGPLTGSALVQWYGFPAAARGVGACCVLASVATALYLAACGRVIPKEIPRLEAPLLAGAPEHLPHGCDMPRSIALTRQASRHSVASDRTPASHSTR